MGTQDELDFSNTGAFSGRGNDSNDLIDGGDGNDILTGRNVAHPDQITLDVQSDAS